MYGEFATVLYEILTILLDNFVKYYHFLNLNKFLTVLLALLLPPLATSLPLALNSFRTNFSNNLVVFIIEVSSPAI